MNVWDRRAKEVRVRVRVRVNVNANVDVYGWHLIARDIRTLLYLRSMILSLFLSQLSIQLTGK
jgi:hypothetical protein